MDALGEISQHARPLEIPGPRLVGIPRVCLQTSYPCSGLGGCEAVLSRVGFGDG